MGFQLFPFIVANSAPPVNITLSDDFGGGEYLPTFNARPAFASSPHRSRQRCGTRWGDFDKVPVPGETIVPANYGTGYGQFTANLRLSKTFSLRQRSAGWRPGRRRRADGGRDGPGPGGLSSMGNQNIFNNKGNTTNRRFNLTFSVSARNIFNNVNYAAPEGNLNSPIFGRPYALAGGFFSSNAANRRIDLQVRFNFLTSSL